MDTIDLYEKIEEYLLGRLPQEERTAFEAEIQSNPVLAEEVALQRDIIIATGEDDVLLLRKKIVDAIAASSAVSQTKGTPGGGLQDVTNSESKPSFPLRWLLILGIVLVVGGMVWFFLISPNTNKQETDPDNPQQEIQETPGTPDALPEQTPDPPREEEQKQDIPTPQKQPEAFLMALANDFYQKDADLEGILMGEEISGDSQLDKALAAYRKKDWSSAATLLQRIEDPEVEIESRQLRADANFKLKQYSKAAGDFKWLSENISIGKYQAEWNLLICYLAQGTGGSKNFDALLRKIKSIPQHPFAEKATELEHKMSR